MHDINKNKTLILKSGITSRTLKTLGTAIFEAPSQSLLIHKKGAAY